MSDPETQLEKVLAAYLEQTSCGRDINRQAWLDAHPEVAAAKAGAGDWEGLRKYVQLLEARFSGQQEPWMEETLRSVGDLVQSERR